MWPAPADYDGDRNVDAAVWGMGTAEWQVDGLGTIGTFAESGYPVPADYSGDGKADPSWVTDNFGSGPQTPNTWDGPGLEPLATPWNSWSANVASWLTPYIVPLTALDICNRFNPVRCGLP
jgi:hypothetical protein